MLTHGSLLLTEGFGDTSDSYLFDMLENPLCHTSDTDSTHFTGVYATTRPNHMLTCPGGDMTFPISTQRAQCDLVPMGGEVIPRLCPET